MTSVRRSLRIRRSASIKQLAHQRNEPFPLSLRKFVGALPPGRILRKVVDLELLQRKFDQFVNQREQPLFRFRLHGEDYGSSTLTVLFEHPVNGLEPFAEKDLGHLEIDLPGPLNPDYHFNDLNSDRFTLHILPDQPAGIEVRIFFETQGEELKINNFPNVDFQALNLTLTFHLTFDAENRLVDLSTDKRSVVADASVDVRAIPDGVVARKIESNLNTKVFEALHEKRVEINRLLTRWLLGGDFYVSGVASDSQGLTIDYILPPGRLEPFPENPQPPLEPGLLANIDHIVVLMMENRSFDHMLGYLSKHGAREDVDGLRGGERNRYKGRDYASFLLTDTQFVEGPCHEYECVLNQVNGGKLDGFVADFAARFEAQGVDPGKIMGYYQAAQVPVYDALAREFLICQRWFCSHPGPTFPNRFYGLTGRLNRDTNGRWELDNPIMDTFAPLATKTIVDHLTEQGVSWQYYEHGYCTLRLFERYTVDNKFILDARDPIKGFYAAARAGTLPAVSFIDPDFIDVPPGTDDHPPADIAGGQRLVAEIVRALIEGPQWSKTLLIITYDEHGGFFDHVAPPQAPAVSGVDHYGPRVPAFAISPWVERGKTSDIVFDHTSILKTIARRFLSARPPDLGERVAAANDLSMVLRPSAREDKPSIPLPPESSRRAFIPPTALTTPEDERDFHALLQVVRARYQVRG
jgi:phospholipase C